MAGNFPGGCLCSVFGAGVFIAGCTILLVSAFPIAEIAIGTVYMYECPVAPMIPVYVMVCGILGLLIMTMFALPNLICPTRKVNVVWTLWNLSLLLVYIIWFIYGSYQIYSIYPPNYNKNIIHNQNHSLPILNRTHNQNLPTLNQTRNQNLPTLNQTRSQNLPTLNQTHNQNLPTLNQTHNQNLPTLNQTHNQNLPTLNQTHNQNLPTLNQTWIINSTEPTRKLLQLRSMSTNMNRDNLDPPRAREVLVLEPYCDRTVYLFAFWTTTLTYVIGGNALVILICICGFIKLADLLTKLF